MANATVNPITSNLRGIDPITPSWLKPCRRNPSLNAVLDSIDAHAMPNFFTEGSVGDLFYLDATLKVTRLTIGSQNQMLTVSSNNIPTWVNQPVIPSGNSGGNKNVVTKTANYTLSTTDDIVQGDATTNPITFTLPTASGNSGKLFFIKKLDDVNTLTINTTGNQLIDGSLTFLIENQWDAYDFYSDNLNWHIK